jgi:hypothetical protein
MLTSRHAGSQNPRSRRVDGRHKRPAVKSSARRIHCLTGAIAASYVIAFSLVLLRSYGL